MTGAAAVPGGIAGVNLGLLRAFAAMEAEGAFRLEVLSLLERRRDRPDGLSNRVTFSAFGGRKPRFAAALLRRSLRRPVYFFDHVGPALPVLPLAAARFVRTILFAHGSEAWKRVRSLDALSIRTASLCLTNSEFTLRKMKGRFPGVRAVACPLGLSPQFPLNDRLDDERPSIELVAADGGIRVLGERVLLLVGRIHPGEREKGHYELLEVFPALLERYPDAQLVFAGPGEDRRNLEALARRLGVGASLFLPGHLAPSGLADLYRRCFAFVMPSRQEGFGLAYLEAMNWGKACLGCFEQGAEDVIVHRETGLLVRDPHDRQELLAALSALLSEPDRTRAMGRRGFERVRAGFTADHFQERVRRAVATVLEESGDPRLSRP